MDIRALASSPAFARWFGDSKVVDAQGLPLVVYHGSPDIRGIFETGFCGRRRMRGEVFFATDDCDVAETYADDHRAWDYQNAEPYTLKLFLAISNPLEINAHGRHWRNTEATVEQAKEGGFDGLIIRNSIDAYNNPKVGGRRSTVYAFFAPWQAKSAASGPIHSRIDHKLIVPECGNSGAYNRESALITQ